MGPFSSLDPHAVCVWWASPQLSPRDSHALGRGTPVPCGAVSFPCSEKGEVGGSPREGATCGPAGVGLPAVQARALCGCSSLRASVLPGAGPTEVGWLAGRGAGHPSCRPEPPRRCLAPAGPWPSPRLPEVSPGSALPLFKAPLLLLPSQSALGCVTAVKQPGAPHPRRPEHRAFSPRGAWRPIRSRARSSAGRQHRGASEQCFSPGGGPASRGRVRGGGGRVRGRGPVESVLVVGAWRAEQGVSLQGTLQNDPLLEAGEWGGATVLLSGPDGGEVGAGLDAAPRPVLGCPDSPGGRASPLAHSWPGQRQLLQGLGARGNCVVRWGGQVAGRAGERGGTPTLAPKTGCLSHSFPGGLLTAPSTGNRGQRDGEGGVQDAG